MFYNIELALIISGFDMDPTHISSLLSLSPSQVWIKGESIQKAALKRKTNGWMLSSGLDKSAELEDHVNAIFAKIKPVLPNFSNLPISAEKELSCTIYIYIEKSDSAEEHRTPAIHLNQEHMEILNKLGAEFDVDLYVLPKRSK